MIARIVVQSMPRCIAQRVWKPAFITSTARYASNAKHSIAKSSKSKPAAASVKNHTQISGTGTIKYENGTTYEGAYLDGKMHGTGTLRYPTGEEFLGTFWNDHVVKGIGTFIYPNGAKCIGQLVKGKLHGMGTFVDSDGIHMLSGEFQHGKIHNGEGARRRSDGVDQGIWRDGKFTSTVIEATVKDKTERAGTHGITAVPNASGSQEVRDALREAEQTISALLSFKHAPPRHAHSKPPTSSASTAATPTVHQATAPVAPAPTPAPTPKPIPVVVTVPEEVYIGALVDGLRQGRGTYTTSGFTYTGHWSKNERNGFGRATYADGSVYEGRWQSNQRHGPGRLNYPDGEVWLGTFREDEVWDGVGRWVVKGASDQDKGDKEVYTGTWVEGKMQGKGSCVLHPRGEMYDGEWRDGKRHGWGVVTYPTGERLEGEFRENNIHHGEGALRAADGQWLRGSWSHGVLQSAGVTATVTSNAQS